MLTTDDRYLGCTRDKCRNQTVIDLTLIRRMIMGIPFKAYRDKKFAAIFESVGGAEQAAAIACWVYRMYLPEGAETDPEYRDWPLMFMPEGDYNPVYEAGAAALREGVVVRMPDGSPIVWRHLFAVAQAFGAPFFGLMDAKAFVYNPVTNKYIYVDGDLQEWPQKSIDLFCQPVQVDQNLDLWLDASLWLQAYCAVTSMTYDPSLPPGIVYGVSITDGESSNAGLKGGATWNLYRPIKTPLGDYDPQNPERFVQPFVEHCHKLFKNEADARQFISWCAHIIQRPGEKVHWAPVLYSYDQGVGKDTLINFVQEIIGSNNCHTVKASQISDKFNEYAASLIIRISEVYDADAKYGRKKFQEEVKTLISGDEPYITVNPKYGVKYKVRNLAHVILTTNNPSDLLVSNKDRRYDVIECASRQDMGIADADESVRYFNALYDWYNNGGKSSLYAFLSHYDLSNFNVALPRVTEAKRKITINSLDTYAWLLPVLDAVKAMQPDIGDMAFRTDTIIRQARHMAENDQTWAGPQESMLSKSWSPAFRALGYEYLRSKNKDGRWSFYRRMVSIIKKTDTPEFNAVEYAPMFAPPEAVGNPHYRPPVAVNGSAELDPDLQALVLENDRNQ